MTKLLLSFSNHNKSPLPFFVLSLVLLTTHLLKAKYAEPLIWGYDEKKNFSTETCSDNLEDEKGYLWLS